MPAKENLPDHDEFIPNTETIKQKVRYLAKVSAEFREHYMKTRAVHKNFKSSNLAELFKQATGKGLKLDDSKGPRAWKSKLISALHSIRTRLKT